MLTKTYLFAALCLAGTTARVLADDIEVDTRAFEYLDVVETADGSIWKGVIVEQTPNVSYKIATADGSLHVIKAGEVSKMSKQKNPNYKAGSVASTGTANTLTAPAGDGAGPGPGPIGPGPTGPANGVGARYEDTGAAGGLPPPVAVSGTRIDVAMTSVVPMGDLSTGKMQVSLAPTFRIGYEQMFGNVGLSGGGLARFTYWRLPDGEDPQDAFWTLETHAYLRGALHMGRTAVYAGGSLGLDTNMVHVGMVNMSKTTEGFGLNLQAGAEIAASPTVAVQVGLDFHPATDTIVDGGNTSVSYFGITAGAAFRL